jgi:phosphomannomutase
MSENLNLSMFRAYDIRTPSARLTPELARRLADAEAVYFREVLDTDSVVVGHDARRTGPGYLTIAVQAYRDAGLEVIYLPGVSSTSYFYYVAMRHPDSAGVMIGASHNPAEDTGRKILGPGVVPIAEGIGAQGGLTEIQRLYQAGRCRTGAVRSRIRPVELMDEYIAHSMQWAGVTSGGLKGLRIFHDYLFGAAGREMMLGFARAGADLSPAHFAADGRFPLGDPNPVKPDVIRDGLDEFAAGGFDLACFFDGDGDRIDFYHGDGTYVASSFVYAALVPEILQRFPSGDWGVYADLKSNPLAVIQMARAGVTVDVIRNGHSQIKQSLYDEPERLGAVEESAHYYEAFQCDGRRFCTENTLYFALLAARVWLEDRPRIERLLEIQRTTVREREWGYKFPGDQQRADALQVVREYFESQGARTLQRMKNGMDLAATLLRRGLPFDVTAQTRLADDWLQVCQRISQSEDGLARWEVVGADPRVVQQARADIVRLTTPFHRSDEYRG